MPNFSGVVAIVFSGTERSSSLVTKWCPTLVTPHIVACHTPLSVGFSRQEYLKGLPCCLSGDCPDPRIEPISYVSCIGRQVLYHLHHLGSQSLRDTRKKSEKYHNNSINKSLVLTQKTSPLNFTEFASSGC